MQMTLQQYQSHEFWAHLEITGTVLIPLILFWLDTRRSTHRNHTENQVRLGVIETKLEPLVRWWNSRKEH